MSSKASSSEKMVLKLSKGEKIVSSLVDFCRQNEIFGGWLSGLGAVSQATLLVYNLEKKKYIKKEFKGKFELANLCGNIAELEGKAVSHIHVVLADEKMRAWAGHLEEATVAATCEIFLDIFEHPIERKHDSAIGLNLIG